MECGQDGAGEEQRNWHTAGIKEVNGISEPGLLVEPQVQQYRGMSIRVLARFPPVAMPRMWQACYLGARGDREAGDLRCLPSRVHYARS